MCSANKSMYKRGVWGSSRRNILEKLVHNNDVLSEVSMIIETLYQLKNVEIYKTLIMIKTLNFAHLRGGVGLVRGGVATPLHLWKKTLRNSSNIFVAV